MKTSVLYLVDGSFLADNGRWYKLARSKYYAPTPKVFASKSKAKFMIERNYPERITDCNFLKPERIKQKEPRGVIVRPHEAGRSRKTR